MRIDRKTVRVESRVRRLAYGRVQGRKADVVHLRWIRAHCCLALRTKRGWLFSQATFSSLESNIGREPKGKTKNCLFNFSDRSPAAKCIHYNPHGVIYESSLRAGHGWRESLYRHQGCFKASDCGRLGRQAAGHPWSALRVVKSCRKDCPTAKVLLEAKAAALHPERYQSSLSKLSTKEGG